MLAQLASLANQAVTAPAYQPQYQYQYTPPINQPPAIGADEYVTGSTLQQQAQQWQQQLSQQAQQFAQPGIEMAASGNLDRVREKYKDVFARYEPEILSTLRTVPKTSWDIDSLTRVVKFVMSDHVDEIALDKARQMHQSQDPALRSSGANGYTTPPSSPAPSPSQALTEAQRTALARNGVSLKTVEEFCAKQSPPMPVEKWFTLYGKHAVGDAA